VLQEKNESHVSRRIGELRSGEKIYMERPVVEQRHESDYGSFDKKKD
jgi:hypothetical protein